MSWVGSGRGVLLDRVSTKSKGTKSGPGFQGERVFNALILPTSFLERLELLGICRGQKVTKVGLRILQQRCFQTAQHLDIVSGRNRFAIHLYHPIAGRLAGWR